jgi:phosphate transport system protein
MTQLELELKSVRTQLINMWKLVGSQLDNTRRALLEFDKDLAREVIMKETRVNGAELNIDQDCENILALLTPVAVDLRFVLAVLKINTNLERIGDIAEGIAKYIENAETPFSEQLMASTKVIQMIDEGIIMLEKTLKAFEREDPASARSVFKMDDFLDEINHEANENVIGYLQKSPEEINAALYILSMIRKLERVGDQVKNIAEEIIFYVEAKVLKHMKE